MIGQGPVGLAISEFCKKSSYDVQCFTRRKKPVSTQYDLVFLCVKAYDIVCALQQHRQIFAEDCVIIVTANGYWPTELDKYYEVLTQRQKIYAGIVRFGATIKNGKVIVSGMQYPGVAIGPVDAECSEPAPAGAEILNTMQNEIGAGSWFELLSAPEITIKYLRNKWFYNCVINSLCAAKNLEQNGLLLNNWQDVEKLAGEVLELGNNLWSDWQADLPSMMENLRLLCVATTQNQNSMVRDINLGRKTEINYLLGITPSDPAKYPYIAELLLHLDK